MAPTRAGPPSPELVSREVADARHNSTAPHTQRFAGDSTMATAGLHDEDGVVLPYVRGASGVVLHRHPGHAPAGRPRDAHGHKQIVLRLGLYGGPGDSGARSVSASTGGPRE
jgi:hypothetical protein